MCNDMTITLNGNGFKWYHVIVGWVSSVTSTAQVGACVARESAAQTVLCSAGARALVPLDRPQTPHHFHCEFNYQDADSAVLWIGTHVGFCRLLFKYFCRGVTL